MTAPQTKVTEPQPREAWAYRARHVDPLVQVLVRRIGSRRPIRALVRFVDPSFEGLEEWVPPARLKAPWAEAEAYEARERRWDAADAACGEDDDPETSAAGIVFDQLIPNDIAELCYHADGALSVRDVPALTALVGLDAADFDHPLSFVDDGMLIVPWPITRAVAKRAAERDATPILRYVQREEADARREAAYGEVHRRRGGPWHISPEICAEVDEEHGRPVRDILRAWCGAEAVDRWDELRELRREVLRLGELVQSAVDGLRRQGARRQADEIERQLGIPVGVLRDRPR